MKRETNPALQVPCCREPRWSDYSRAQSQQGLNPMSEHQALPVKGYVPQSDTNVQLVNRNKEAEERMLRILDDLENGSYGIDRRWLAIGRTHLEQAFMAINRSIFKPTRIKL
jgi:hypothetical protein